MPDAPSPPPAAGPLPVRTPYFCSAARTTPRPGAGRLAARAGIGCHFMANWMERDTTGIVPMGAEGVDWTGQAPFTRQTHVFQNLGDGTYFHSGHAAIRQAVASGANITYKILYNDAVAMTGGQPVDGVLTVPQITRLMAAEGARKVVVVSDDPARVARNAARDPLGPRRHRASPRRPRRGAARVARDPRRHRAGLRPDLRHRGAPTAQARPQPAAGTARGDQPPRLRGLRRFARRNRTASRSCRSRPSSGASAPSTRPAATATCPASRASARPSSPLGAPPRGGVRRRDRPGAVAARAAALPEPDTALGDAPYEILVAGVGGTGVVTVGALITMAAHLEGHGASVLDFMGFARRAGRCSPSCGSPPIRPCSTRCGSTAAGPTRYWPATSWWRRVPTPPR